MKARASVGCVIIVVILSMTLALVSWAGNFWEEKPYQEWDRIEVQTIISRSPWSQSVEVGQISRGHDWGGLSRPEGGAQPGGAGVGTVLSPPPSAAGTTPRAGSVGDDASEGQRSSRPGALAYYVIWSSALTVRRALARNHVLQGLATLEQAEQSLQMPLDAYTITIVGPDMSAFDRVVPGQLEERTHLQLKKQKQKVAPLEVKIARSGEAEKVSAVMFLFPRQLPSGEPVIRPDEKKVEFQCEIKEPRVKIKTYFDPRRMTLNGEADL